MKMSMKIIKKVDICRKYVSHKKNGANGGSKPPPYGGKGYLYTKILFESTDVCKNGGDFVIHNKYPP